MTRLEEYKKTCRKYLYFKDTQHIDIIFGTVFANRLDARPVWIYIVGPPSSSKTEIIRTLSDSPEIYSLSRLTPKDLISGVKTKDKKKISLLSRLDGKVLTIKDFTAMLSMRYNDLMEVIGQLRDAYDGSSAVAFGTGDVRFKSKFGLIACVTGAIDKHARLVTDLGERFVTYRMPPISRLEESKRCLKAMSIKSVKEKEKELSKAALKVLERKPKPATLSEFKRLRILNLAQVVASARSTITRDQFTKEPEIPSVELAIRLTEQLSNLAIGIAMAREKRRVTDEEMKLTMQVGVHSLTAKRMMLIESLLSYWPEPASVGEIIDKLSFSFSESVVRRWLEDMLLLKLVERVSTVGTKGKMYYRWQLTNGRLLKDVLFQKGSKL